MNDAPPKAPAEVAATSTARFQMQVHFIKSTAFRTIHSQGAWFGGDQEGNVHLTFFNERNPIPQKIVLNLDGQGFVLGEDESKKVSKAGIVREMEANVIMSFAAAVNFHKLLGENLKAIQQAATLPVSEKIKAFQENIIK